MKKLPISPVFVPANKLDLIEKIIKSDADGMIIDLEDSVPLAEKDTSRDSLYKFLSHNILNKTVLVRINPTGTEEGKNDLKQFSQLPKGVRALVVPKIENPEDLELLPDVDLFLLIETPLAVRNLSKLSSDKRVLGLILGGVDLSTSLGSDMEWDSLLYHRSKVVLECAINNLHSLDSPFMEISNLEKLAKECAASSGLGFNGKAAIHPNQVQVILKEFLPSEQEIKEALEVLEAFNESKGAVISVKGKMIDKPVAKAMELKLRLAGIEIKD